MLTICKALKKMGYIIDFYYTGFEKELTVEHQNFFNGRLLDYNIQDIETTPLKRYLWRGWELLNGVKIRWNRLIRKVKDGDESATFNRSLHEYQNVGKIQLLLKQIENQQYNVVIVNYAVYSFYFDYLEPSILKILDTHDRLTDRFKMYLNEGKVPADWHSLRKQDEKKSIRKADVVWAITENENKHYQTLIGDKKIDIKTIRHLIEYNRIESKETQHKILIIGSDNSLNIDGLSWYLKYVWPRIIDSYNAELIVAGTLCQAKSLFTETEKVQFYGTFEDEEEVYSLADICINPMQSGTGLKIKTLEALAHGKIVLSTTEGASGITEFQNNGLFISDSPDEWVQTTGTLLTGTDKKDALIKKAEVQVNAIHNHNFLQIKESLEMSKQVI